jgi:hypothetical protein
MEELMRTSRAVAREQAAELAQQERREALGDQYTWHPEDSRANSRFYPQVWRPKPVKKGVRRKVILTEATIAAIDRKIRAIRAAGTNGFRMSLADFAEALGQSHPAGRRAIMAYLREVRAVDVVYLSEDQIWTGGV